MRFERNGNLTAHTYTCFGAIYLEELLFQKFVDALRVQGQLVTAGRKMPWALLFYYTIWVYRVAFVCVCVYVWVHIYIAKRSWNEWANELTNERVGHMKGLTKIKGFQNGHFVWIMRVSAITCCHCYYKMLQHSHSHTLIHTFAFTVSLGEVNDEREGVVFKSCILKIQFYAVKSFTFYVT